MGESLETTASRAFPAFHIHKSNKCSAGESDIIHYVNFSQTHISFPMEEKSVN